MSGPRQVPGGEDDLDEQISATDGLLLPGGKVDPEAIRRLSETGESDDDAELRRVTFRLRRDLNKRLDRYLTDRITFMSRSQLQRLIDDGGVLVNNRPPKASTTLRKGDVVEVVIPLPPATEIQPEDIPLEVLFEDEHLVVINKPAGIIVHPARSHLKGTMVNALAWHFRHRTGGALSGVGGEFARPGVVHRLDRHTSGVIVFAKRDEAHWKLGHQFQARTVDKRYLAVVEGTVEPDVQVIDLPIGPSRSREKGYRETYCVRHDEQGREAVTICRVRERYFLSGGAKGPRGKGGRGSAAPGSVASGTQHAARRSAEAERSTQHAARGTQPVSYSLVELELKTGRTHQIRVHLSYLGWPIVGDDMYGGKPYANAATKTTIDRQALHATVLGFTHPVTNERLVFTAPLRGDIAALVRDLRARDVESVEAPGATVDLAAAVGGP